MQAGLLHQSPASAWGGKQILGASPKEVFVLASLVALTEQAYLMNFPWRTHDEGSQFGLPEGW